MSKSTDRQRKTSNRAGSPRPRRSRNTYTTKSGKTIKLNRSLSDKVRNAKENWLQHKSQRLAGMPKTHLKRFLFRLKPKNLYHYWFSREGAIMALKLFGIGVVVAFVLLVSAFAYFRKDLPQINSIYGQNLGGSISYYDSTGQTLIWQDYNAIKRVPVPGNEISGYMKNATVAIEDKNFYHEGAFDLGAIFRSAFHDIFSSGGGLYGGSTITQQLVKLNENWTDNRTIGRKIKEVILASELEREYSKDDILAGYLNIAPYGGVDYGVQTAAEDYFGISAANLTLPQAAMLAAIPQSPDYYSPYSPDFSQSALVGREEYILELMQKQGYITKAQEKAAFGVNVVAEVQPQTGNVYNNIIAPYFVTTAKEQLENQFGTQYVETGGLKVITTLNLAQQAEAEKLVADNLPNVERYDGDSEAIVTENVPTGQVTSLVGGVGWNTPGYGQINYATSLIEPGSSYKLYDYTALINDNDNVGAGSVLYDIQQPLPGYPCTNKAEPLKGGNCLEDYDFRYPGPETIRYAMAGSRNVPAVKALLINGEQKTISLSEQMGLTSGYNCYSDVYLTQTTACYGSAAIGDGAYLRLNEHVNGFATDARLGNYVPQTFILKVIDSTGKVIYNWTPPKPVQVVKPDAAYIIDNIISDPRASYLPGSCSTTNCSLLSAGGYKFQRINGWDVGVKTGTTNDNYDGLMMSITTQYAVGTWVGYHTREQALVAGGMEYLTEPLARGMQTYLIGDSKPINWVQPSDIKVLPAYVETAHVGLGSEEPSPSTDLYPSWYKQPTESTKSYTVDIVSGKLATSCTPPLARKAVSGDSNANIFSIDTFVNSPSTVNLYNTTQDDDVHLCGDELPTITLQGAQSNSPPACTANVCTFDAAVTPGTHPLGSATYPMQVNAVIDGTSIIPATCSFASSVTQDPTVAVSGTCTFPYAQDGSHSFAAQVIDSVLYSANSTTATMNLPGGTAAVNADNSVTISWTPTDSGTYTVNVTDSGGTSYPCNVNVSTTGCSTAPLPAGTYTAIITDDNNGASEDGQPISFSVN